VKPYLTLIIAISFVIIHVAIGFIDNHINEYGRIYEKIDL